MITVEEVEDMAQFGDPKDPTFIPSWVDSYQQAGRAMTELDKFLEGASKDKDLGPREIFKRLIQDEVTGEEQRVGLTLDPSLPGDVQRARNIRDVLSKSIEEKRMSNINRFLDDQVKLGE